MKLLYITFIDMNNSPKSGSAVRPLKMLQAFRTMDIEIIVLSGQDNKLNVRRRNVKKIKDKLKSWRPDICYIEPPSGPMFYYGDIRLIKMLHKERVPMSIFYRDAYWKYPEYYITEETPVINKAKYKLIKIIQIYQWKVFNKNIDKIYFPSISMANEFECYKKDVLPPGSFEPNIKEKCITSEPLQFIFVGGAEKNHGTFLTIEAFEKANKYSVKAKLFYICPEDQWNNLGIDKDKYSPWLKVIHKSGDKNLKPYYEESDIALLTAPRTFYRDFAVPIKIFEYISYLKPILVTNCTETACVVERNKVGWVVEDNPYSIKNMIDFLCSHPEEIEKIKKNMLEARTNNLWIIRAKKVVNDLMEIKRINKS